jgi:hypothetical protein
VLKPQGGNCAVLPYIKKKHLCIQKQPISYRDRRGYAS